MSLAITGMRATYMVGAAGATNLWLQPVQAQPAPQADVSLQAVTTPQTGPAIDAALPAMHAMDTAAIVAVGSIAAVQSFTLQNRLAQEQKLADAIDVRSSELWRLAARFLANPETFTDTLAANKSEVDSKRASAVFPKQHAAVKTAPVISAPDAPVEAQEVNHQEPTQKLAKAKTNPSLALMDSGIEIEVTPSAFPSLPKATAAVTAGAVSTQTTPRQADPLKTDAAVAQATGPFESVVPYSVSQLERARTILRTAGVVGGEIFNGNSSTVSRAKASDSCEVFRSQANPRPLQGIARQAHANSKKSHTSQTFKRSHAVGRSPAFLVGNIKSRKVRKTEPAQIIRVATAGNATRRIVFARVPGTKGEYRLKGIDHPQIKAHTIQERAAAHALMTPYAEQALQRTTLGLAPRSAGARPGGELAYQMPDPRELRDDEREVLVSLIKEQLSLGPASLKDPAIREQFNAFLFSNTVGEMSHYVTADQWNAMVRASILYAAHAVSPRKLIESLINKTCTDDPSIAHRAAKQLFKNDDALARYMTWTAHYGISGLGDIATVDTFLDENRLLTMPKYFFKGIMDQLLERAPTLQGYDEARMPLSFATAVNLEWLAIGLIHDPEITSDAELIEAATAIAEEIAAVDAQAAQHFIEFILLSTMIKTGATQEYWSEEQASALLDAMIQAGLGDVLERIGRNRSLPRRPRRLVAMAQEKENAAEDAQNRYEVGLDRLTRNLAELLQSGAIFIDDEADELHAN